MHMPRLLALGVQNVEIVSKELVLWRPVRFGSVLRMFRGRHDRRAFVEISTDHSRFSGAVTAYMIQPKSTRTKRWSSVTAAHRGDMN